ncbi:MAG: DoxX family protein [Gammaproteobacteria bacterium]
MNTLVAPYSESLIQRVTRLWLLGCDLANKLAPLGDLALRLWVANEFFKSGLTKIQSWETTLQLFQYEYQVPLLPPALAAVMGTATELGMPVFIALGLAGRMSAGVLFVFNIIAVISYPALEPAGLAMHYAWGVVLFALCVRGPGRLSIDHTIRRAFAHSTGAR